MHPDQLPAVAICHLAALPHPATPPLRDNESQTRDRLLGLLLCYITFLLVLGALTSLAGWPQPNKELVRACMGAARRR